MAPTRRNTAFTAAASIASVAGLLGTLYYLDLPSMLRRRVKARQVEPRCYSTMDRLSVTDLQLLTDQITLQSTYRLAARIEKNIPIYDCRDFDLADTSRIDRLKDELYHNLTAGPGVYVLQHFFQNLTVIDATNTAYDEIIAAELAANGAKGDHFAPSSANSRIWNSFSKHARHDPASYLDYFSNPWFKIACDSYLGPAYQITSQVNIVRPGGKAQMPHRDYHLGFQTDADVVAWPKAVHAFTSFLTLQGAVAHTDMPLESGPTRFLPYSQTFPEGFRAYRSPEFVKFFQDHYVSVALEKGDAVFFSPALFHAAGENTTEAFSRSANLIQVSSAFGKTMETIDTLALVEQTYEGLAAKYKVEGMSMEVDAFIRAVADGYPFPTNLDCRPPAPNGMAPESEQDVLRRAISEAWDKDKVVRELTDMRDAASAIGTISRQTTVFGT